MGFDEENNNQGGGGGIAGALIGAGAMLYDSHANRKNSKENTQRTIAAQKAESELAYQRSIEQWNAQNLYNTPQAQMQRFQEAGLNPHLIYGQGSSGLASSPPQYQPANMQYRYEAPTYGAGIQSILPTLMAVGTWMQNMRSSEVQIQKGSTETERSRQMIEFLERMNPKSLEKMDWSLSGAPFQTSILGSQAEIANAKLHEIGQEFQYKYGTDLWEKTNIPGVRGDSYGIRKIQYMQEAAKNKLLQAKSSWTDYNITDPQSLIQMVMQGVMGMAGQQLRFNQKAKPPQPKRERPRGLSYNRMSRNHPDRR